MKKDESTQEGNSVCDENSRNLVPLLEYHNFGATRTDL